MLTSSGVRVNAESVRRAARSRFVAKGMALLVACTLAWLSACSRHEPHAATPGDDVPDADIGAFLEACDSLGQRPGERDWWKWDEQLAARHGIATPPPTQTWGAMLERSLQAGWRSRLVLQVGAQEWGAPFLWSMHDAYAGGTDALAEIRLAALLIEEMPEDRRTAQYALAVADRHWDSAWPDDLDFHGNQPRDAIRLEVLPKIWVVPGGTLADEQRLRQWLRLTRAASDAWHYDARSSRWRAT